MIELLERIITELSNSHKIKHKLLAARINKELEKASEDTYSQLFEQLKPKFQEIIYDGIEEKTSEYLKNSNFVVNYANNHFKNSYGLFLDKDGSVYNEENNLVAYPENDDYIILVVDQEMNSHELESIKSILSEVYRTIKKCEEIANNIECYTKKGVNPTLIKLLIDFMNNKPEIKSVRKLQK